MRIAARFAGSTQLRFRGGRGQGGTSCRDTCFAISTNSPTPSRGLPVVSFLPHARAAEWWVDAVPAGALSLQQIQIGGSATFAGDGQLGSFTIGIPMTRPQSIRIDGQRLDSNAFIVLKQDQPFTFAGQDVTRWAGVTLPVDHRLARPRAAREAARERGRLHAHRPIATRTAALARRPHLLRQPDDRPVGSCVRQDGGTRDQRGRGACARAQPAAASAADRPPASVARARDRSRAGADPRARWSAAVHQ